MQEDFRYIYRSMLPTLTVTEYERLAKHYFLNNSLQVHLHFQNMWTLNLAWTIYYQMYFQNDFLSREELVDVLVTLAKFEKEFKFPRFIWSKGLWQNDPAFDFYELLNVMKQVVSIESLTGQENEVANFIKRFGEEAGLDSAIDEFGNVTCSLRGKNNMKFAFVFHTDTVPGKIQLRVQEGKLFGRGSVDNKVFGVMAIYAMILLKRSGIVPDFTIEVFGEASEESEDKDKKGLMKALKKGWGRSIVQAVILEASGGRIMTGQRKRIVVKVGIYGEGHHSSHVDSAQIEIRISNKEALSCNQKVDLRIPFDHAVEEIRLIPHTRSLSPGKFGVTTITAEAQYSKHPINMTPKDCEIVVEARLGDDEHRNLILNEIESILARWCDWARVTHEILEVKEGAEPDYLAGETGAKTIPFLKEFKPLFEILQADPMTRNFYKFSTSGQLLASWGIPVFGYSTAPEERAHVEVHERLREKSNSARNDEEYITMYEVLKALIAYLALMQLAMKDDSRILLAKRPTGDNQKPRFYT